MKDYPYLINIFWSEEDQIYMAEAPELEGCITHGNSPEEAVRKAGEAIKSWIQAAKKLKHPLPQPVTKRRVSGKFNVRIPKTLHKSLIVKSAQEGVSLNHLVTTLLSQNL